ncbi:MAG: SDR family oxidoreductase [Alicyclobacillus sp.]|nr:SDR family oxidoreductase [Alicyclobacillus sp.]
MWMTRNALVTGASRGIGEGIAMALAEAGYDIVFCHHHDNANAARVKEVIESKYGRRCEWLEGDLSTETFPSELFQFAAAKLGTIHVLINNAGQSLFEPILDLTLETTNRLFGLNYRAPLLLMQAVASHLIQRNMPGSIVNVASTRGFRAYPEDAVYGGLKAALIRSTESIALDLAPYGIRVNCVAPGAIQVDPSERATRFYETLGKRIPLGRAGTPTDIGRAVAWLVSDQASYVTGTTLRVDGGLILPGMPEHVPDGYGNYGWGVMRD